MGIIMKKINNVPYVAFRRKNIPFFFLRGGGGGGGFLSK